MISQRHKWLLRDVATCFDYMPHGDSICRVCRVSDRGDIRVPRPELERHLANHRRETIVKEEKVDLFEGVA